jgi:uncharacterized protein (TIGR03437 family)
MAHITPNGRAGYVRIISLAAFFFIFSFCVFGQEPTCNVGVTTPTVHAEGLAEPLGNIQFSCSGGTGMINTLLVVTLNANITNRLDVNGNPTGVTLTGAGVTAQTPTFFSPTSIAFGSVQFGAGSVSFTISGLLASVATVSGGGARPSVNASFYASQLALTGPQPQVIAVSAPTLLSSVLNYGVPCAGSPFSPLPATIDFNALIAAGTASSTIRITEASVSAFSPKAAGADFGVRFLVNISGYGSNAQVYVPDVIVGDSALPTPTSAGAFNISANGGTYNPGTNQLLLARVGVADATGAGGAPVLAAVPFAPQSFTSVTQLALVNGAAYVTYEVLAANPSSIDSAQIPVFVVVPQTTCPDSLENTLGATLAPASSVSVATLTDPIPRYIATTPATDCGVFGDCAASYFPILQIGQTTPPITLNGSSQGNAQTAVITVNNGGGSQMTFNISTTYQPTAGQSAANWLSISANTGVVEGGSFVPLTFSASPAALLIQGAYQATVTINAGSAGTIAIPVTLNVGPPGPTIQSVVNAANSAAGAAITADSFAAIYGLDLAPKTTTPAAVTFAGANAIVVYDSATQINVLVPATLGSATTAGVIATIDGLASNTFTVNLVTNAPAVFNPGILNQPTSASPGGSVNSASAPASLNDIVQVFLTGLATPVTVPVTVTIGGLSVTGSQITYAGAVPSVPGLEQVNVQVPSALTFTGNSASLSICVPGASGQPACSAPVPLYLH